MPTAGQAPHAASGYTTLPKSKQAFSTAQAGPAQPGPRPPHLKVQPACQRRAHQRGLEAEGQAAGEVEADDVHLQRAAGQGKGALRGRLHRQQVVAPHHTGVGRRGLLSGAGE